MIANDNMIKMQVDENIPSAQRKKSYSPKQLQKIEHLRPLNKRTQIASLQWGVWVQL